MDTPQSKLTLERPDLWTQALDLATGLTGYTYAPKLTIEACGGGGYVPPSKKEQIRRKKEMEKEYQEWIDKQPKEPYWRKRLKEVQEELERLREEVRKEEKDKEERDEASSSLIARPVVLVPEGAAEWLLHEVGHWLAATPSERLLPDYGCIPGLLTPEQGKHRELEAWAFEVIVLEPFGPARSFCPPEHSGGEAWKNALDPMHFRRIERQIKSEGVDVDQWQHLYGEWAQWYKTSQA